MWKLESDVEINLQIMWIVLPERNREMCEPDPLFFPLIFYIFYTAVDWWRNFDVQNCGRTTDSVQ